MSNKKHALYSASGSERWINCPASIRLSEGQPDLPTIAAATQGTDAHSVLEVVLNHYLITGEIVYPKIKDKIMLKHIKDTVRFIFQRFNPKREELLVEEKVSLEFIEPDMFGTTDIIIVEPNGVLQVWDFKYGTGHTVEPMITSKAGFEYLNPQLSFYALGVAHKFNYKFKKVVIGVIQPRVKHVFGTERSVTISIDELKKEINVFKSAVTRTKKPNSKPFEGPWCFFCKAKYVCPLKVDKRVQATAADFEDV